MGLDGAPPCLVSADYFMPAPKPQQLPTEPDLKLAALMDARLKSLPLRRAPQTLSLRVMAAIRQAESRPWWQRPWLAWPSHWRILSLAVSLGLVVGLDLAVFLSKGLTVVLFQVDTKNPLMFAAVMAALGLTGIVAILIPARRATRIDPLMALRYD